MMSATRILPSSFSADLGGITRAHRRYACRYCAASVILFVVGGILIGSDESWGWLLIWSASSCAYLSLAYCINRVELISADRCLVHSWPTRIGGWFLLLPYRVGAWCSWRLYSQKVKEWDEITLEDLSSGILVGRHLLSSEVDSLTRKNITAVLDLAPELPRIGGLESLGYKQIAMLDLVPAPCEILQEAVDFISSQPERSNIYVHCALGYSRSVAVVVAYLVFRGAKLSTALAQVFKYRSGAVLHEEYHRRLEEFEHCCQIGINRYNSLNSHPAEEIK
jgi:hypothetical protein